MESEEPVTRAITTGGIVPRTMPENEEREVDFRFHILAILNRRWMVLTLTAIVVLITTVYSFITTPLYRTKAVVDLSPPPIYVALPDSSQSLYLRADSFLNTQYRVLNGKSLAKRVAESLSLTKSDLRRTGFSGKGTSTGKTEEELNEIAGQLLTMLRVIPVPNTNLCEIVFTTPDARLSATLANSWSAEYVTTRLDSLQQYTRTTEEMLTDQVKSLQKDIADAEKELHDYSLKNNIIKLDKDRSIIAVRLTDLNNDLTNATRDRINSQIKYEAMKNSSIESVPEVQANQTVQQKASELAALEKQYTDKARLYKSDYPEIVRLKEMIAQSQKALGNAREQAFRQLVAGAYQQYREALTKESTLKNTLEQARVDSAETGNKELDYDQLSMEIANKKELLALLLQKENQTGVSAEMQQKTIPTSRIVETAEIPKKIFSPDIGKNIFFSLLISFFGSIGLALLLDYVDRSLKTAEDVEEHLRLPYLGMVPFYVVGAGNGNGNSKEIAKRNGNHRSLEQRLVPYKVSIYDAASSTSEAIKTVRTSLLLAFAGGPPKTILVTSSRAGEGKTFIACNLAVALAQLEKRVVVIDADMRNPNVHRAWEIPNDMGLSIYLTNDVPVSSVIKKAGVSQLSIITSGPKTPRPAELLASSRFENLLKQLENDFDFIIIDSPPVLPVADSVILGSKVQGILMIVRGGTTPRDVVKMAKKKLNSSNGVIVGTVLNGIDLADPYYYYRYYSDYYVQYYGDQQKSVETDAS